MSLTKNIDTGSYAGNGTSQTVTIGWQPAEVIIVGDRTGGPTGGRAACFKDSAMADDDFLEVRQTTQITTANGITLTATGFSVGSDAVINNSGNTFYWIAFRQSPWVDVVTWTGDGVGGGQAITTGRQPLRVRMAQVSGAEAFLFKHHSAGAGGIHYETTGAVVDPLITMQATGFLVQADANLSAESYAAVVQYRDSGSTQHLEEGSFTGSGVGQTITLGQQPKVLLILNETNPRIFFKTGDMPTDNHAELSSAYNWMSPGEITITATGFSVTGNADASGDTIRYLAIYH
ncbi:MAG TPA: hypothetical protein VM389_03785 [Phycisphaerae bacterium]|nr:hypothetical protein [Phycisphaerae bacterium]HUU60099.1 hypothetical protein [Phycisphaerae bacterium]